MKKLLFFLCAVFTSHLLMAQSVVGVPHITVPGISVDKWNITLSANVHYIDGKFVESKVLKLTQTNISFRDFKFAIPANAVIQGIDVRIWRKKKGLNTVKDVTVALLRPINETEALGKGPNLAKADPWTETISTQLYSFPATYTFSDDKVYQWSAAEVNHPAFCLFLGISVGTGKGATLLIDKVELTIKYTQGATSTSQTSAALDVSAIDFVQLDKKFRVRVQESGRYVFTIRTTAGVIVQQTTLSSGKLLQVPVDARLKGYYIISVEGQHHMKSQLVYIN